MNLAVQGTAYLVKYFDLVSLNKDPLGTVAHNTSQLSIVTIEASTIKVADNAHCGYTALFSPTEKSNRIKSVCLDIQVRGEGSSRSAYELRRVRIT